ncbi:serine O-acetyltransferase EpsC [Desulfococcus sp.]|uniref:serine O-acetyltransferase EpsC n=1 Tax=Desulfococcus sp. TaxID=2025834 RepID=UPI003593FDA2
MKREPVTEESSCRSDAEISSNCRAHLPEIVKHIVRGCEEKKCYHHIAYEPIPSRESVIQIVEGMRDILFPGYFSRSRLDPVNLEYTLGQSVSVLYDMLAEQICRSIRHDCFRYDNVCVRCEEQGQETALSLFRSVPEIQEMLAADVSAAYDGDPAARSHDEIIFSYPGIFAIMVYRVAHRLFELKIPLLPRIMTEYAHSITGIDIHPGAEIGLRFVIDHGTGVVIGETTEIGNDVRVYQGVTLGALSLPKDAGERLRGKKRHPTIEDDVIIYSGATILGGDTVIGRRSVIGGNVWITESIPPDTRVLMEPPKLLYR